MKSSLQYNVFLTLHMNDLESMSDKVIPLGVFLTSYSVYIRFFLEVKVYFLSIQTFALLYYLENS